MLFFWRPLAIETTEIVLGCSLQVRGGAVDLFRVNRLRRTQVGLVQMASSVMVELELELRTAGPRGRWTEPKRHLAVLMTAN
mgnify:CR=1 FL=1